MSIPKWWNESKLQVRPQTVGAPQVKTARTRKELLSQRKDTKLKSSILMEKVQLQDSHGSTITIGEAIPAGKRPYSRDFRDRVTAQPGHESIRDQAQIKYYKEVNDNTEKYSTLSALKQGRLQAERRETQLKTDTFIRRKSMAELRDKQVHHDMAKKKTKPKMKVTRSQADLNNEEINRGPTMEYVTAPPTESQTKLFIKRKQEFLSDMKKYELEFTNHKNAEQRLNQRELCNIRLSTKKVKLKVKKREEFEPKMKYGVHTNPLPLFSKHNKQWWTNSRGYNPNPKETSQLKLIHKILMKNPNDIYLFDDKNKNSVVKKEFTMKSKEKDYTEKPNNVKVLYRGNVLKKNTSQMRWTNVQLMHNQKKRIFDCLTDPSLSKGDLEPMYSSFNAKGVFHAPPSSKEALQRQVQHNVNDVHDQDTIQSQNQEVDETAIQMLDTNKVNFFERVKTAYGKRPNDNELSGDYFNNSESKNKEVVTFRASNQIGFRTSAFRTIQ